MAVPQSSTFDYKVTVPDNPHDGLWQARLAEPIQLEKDPLNNRRLVGHFPKIEITDAGPTPNPGYDARGVWRPLVERSQIRMIVTDKENATANAASFFVARSLISKLQPGDSVHMAWDLGTGLTVIRDGLLVAGAGAITSVPLGRDVKVIATYELANKAADIFRRHDPEFDVDFFPEIPVGLQIGARRFIRYGGRFKADGYDVMVMHGSYAIEGGEHECVAIARTEACHSSAAIDTAFLLDLDDLAVEGRD